MAGEIIRVTAGDGGESILITGSGRTAVYDTGMSYCGRDLVRNINKELKGRRLDCVLLSHTHYDHIGGLPYLKEEWPDLEIYGSYHGQKVLKNPKALSLIRNLSETASKKYLGDSAEPLDYRDEDILINKAVREGDIISLGDRIIRVYETKGHTKCSLSYFLEKESILFASESTGVMLAKKTIHPSILSSYKESMESIEKCRSLNARHIFCPHYLLVEDDFASVFWDTAKEVSEELKDMIINSLTEGLAEDKILEKCKDRFWSDERNEQQPLEAFLINMKATVNVFRREFF